MSVVSDMGDCRVTAPQGHPPVWPPRFVVATLNAESKSTVSILFSVNAKPFNDGFDGINIGRKVIVPEDSANAEY